MTINKLLLILAVICFALAFLLPLVGVAGMASINLVALGLCFGFGSFLP